MKILYLIHQFFPMHYTGTEKVVLNIASMMQKYGNKVKVLTYSLYQDDFYDQKAGNMLIRDFTYKGIPVLAIKHQQIPFDINYRLHDKALADTARELLERERPDLVHLCHPMRIGEFAAAARGLGIPYLITVTDFWFLCPKITLVNSMGDLCAGPRKGAACKNDCPELDSGQIVERLSAGEKLLSGAQGVIAPSNLVASLLSAEMPDLVIDVIPHGLRYGKLTANTKNYRDGDAITLCYAGSFNYHKGVHVLIDAMKKVKSSNVALRIYGSGDVRYTASLHNSAADDDRISFCGVYSEDQLAEIFKEVDVVVIPSLWYETYSLIMHEALASRVPVIASNVGVMAEKIQPAVNGFTFQLGDPDHLADILESVANNPEQLNSLKSTWNIAAPSIEQEAYAYSQIYTNTLVGDRPRWTTNHDGTTEVKMRIVLVAHEFFPESTGGVEVLTLNTAKTLKERGYDVRIITGYAADKGIQDNDKFDSYVYEGFTVERYKHTPDRAGSQTNPLELEYNNLLFASYFRKYLNRWRPDVVHFFHLHRISASAIDVCVELGIPTVYTTTDFWPICPLSQLRQIDNSPCAGPEQNAVNCLKHMVQAFQPVETREKMAKLPSWLIALAVGAIKYGIVSKFRFAPHIKALSLRPQFMMARLNKIDRVLLSTRLMETLLEKNGLNKTGARFQQYGIDMQAAADHLRRDRGTTKKLFVGYIGALFEHKGVHLLIEAISSLPPEIDLEVNIYGDRNQCPEYSERLNMLAAKDDRIKFRGTFPNIAIGSIFDGLDVLVVPSIWYENTPLVIFSAQAFGCPVIATNLGGMSEVVHNGGNGLLFEKDSVQGLASAILRLYRDRMLVAKLASNAKRPKSMVEYVTELEEYYREISPVRGSRL